MNRLASLLMRFCTSYLSCTCWHIKSGALVRAPAAALHRPHPNALDEEARLQVVIRHISK